jgi:hypothetical protein
MKPDASDRSLYATEDDLTVWFSMLDGKYMVKVTRIEPYRGELTIAEGKIVLHREDVLLNFDALFGPDMADVASLQESAITFVDKLQQSQSRGPKCALAAHYGIHLWC